MRSENFSKRKNNLRVQLEVDVSRKELMGVVRITKKRRDPFVQVDLKTVCDASVSLQELGLLTYLLSKKDDYEFRVEVIARERKISKAQIYRVLNKLIAAGYIHRILITIHISKGRFNRESRYQVFETREMCQEYRDQIRFGRGEAENEVTELHI